MKPKYDLMMFDLDGTLTDSSGGIFESIKYSLNKMNCPIPEEKTLRKFIGPPLFQSFKKYCGMDDEDANRADSYFRKSYYETGAFNNTLFPHMEELLKDLKNAGANLAVVTSKPITITPKVLEFVKVTQYFNGIFAPDEGEHSGRKCLLINDCLKTLKVKPENAVMIGDTHFDAAGARESGTNFIGVLFGFGSKQEMVDEGGKVFARDLDELKSSLLENS